MQYGFTQNSAKGIPTGPGTVIKNYGLPGQAVLGATSGGTAFNIWPQFRNVKVDAPSEQIKGYKKWNGAAPMLKVNLIELTVDTLLIAIPGFEVLAGTNKYQLIEDEHLGTGDGIITRFQFDHDDVDKNTARIYLEAGADPVLQTSGYTIYNVGDVGHTGGGVTVAEIVFTAPVANGTHIGSDYRYDTGVASSHTKLVVNEINDEDYLDNIALLYDHGDNVEPGIILLENALGSIDGDIQLQDKSEGVAAVTFSAHFTPANLEALANRSKQLKDVYPAQWWLPNS